MQKYAKAIVAILSAALVAAATALPDYNNQIQIAIAIVAAVGVYLVPNKQAA